MSKEMLRVTIDKELIKKGLEKLSKEHTIQQINGKAKNKSIRTVLIEEALKEYIGDKK